ncbi:MAG: integrase core domain-containing protein [Nitrososphaeraceae archaeon]
MQQSRFISTLKVYGIRHEVTGKNRPDHNAYIEAFHKSLKEDCIWQHEFQTFQEADLVICKFFQLEQAAFIIKVHDTEGVLCYDKWR